MGWSQQETIILENEWPYPCPKVFPKVLETPETPPAIFLVILLEITPEELQKFLKRILRKFPQEVIRGFLHWIYQQIITSNSPRLCSRIIPGLSEDSSTYSSVHSPIFFRNLTGNFFRNCFRSYFSGISSGIPNKITPAVYPNVSLGTPVNNTLGIPLNILKIFLDFFQEISKEIPP